jgi:sirohydrochlorin cobaltochelatase
MCTRGLLLFAHGARDPLWAEPFRTLAARTAQRRSDTAVRLAYLEFMQPTLAQAGAELAGIGCVRVDVVPVFLGTGGHVRRDLPRLLDELAQAHPGVHWRLQRALGERDRVIDAMADEVLLDLDGRGP